ncbi:MAG: hypothetical protein SXQ77_01790, partial [Halobacteria archaeon]|nr:hypothetical protein [Halobacteria archaeon]
YPEKCGTRNTVGVLSAVPALLSGTACCGPIILIALGIQASSLLIGVFGVLLPIAFLLLLGSLALTARQVNVDFLASEV